MATDEDLVFIQRMADVAKNETEATVALALATVEVAQALRDIEQNMPPRRGAIAGLGPF